jgi:hypothetical protein
MSQKCSQDTINAEVNKRLKNSLSSTSDIQQQMAINQALTDAGLPQNKINSLVELAKERLMCDSACQKEKKSAELKKKFAKAQTNLKDAPEEVSLAEKNYYVFAKGYPAYEDMLFDRYSKTAEELKTKSVHKHKNLMKEIDTYISDYKAETTYSKRMRELLKVRTEENRKLRREIENDIAVVQTNDRRVTYEDEELDSADSARKVLRFVYYFLLVFWILLGDFFPKARYSSLKTWGLIAVYIAFPFVLNKIIELIYTVTGKISYIVDNKAPKNVYTNL